MNRGTYTTKRSRRWRSLRSAGLVALILLLAAAPGIVPPAGAEDSAQRRACDVLLEGRDAGTEACEKVDQLDELAYRACEVVLAGTAGGGACTSLVDLVVAMSGCSGDAACTEAEVINAVNRAVEDIIAGCREQLAPIDTSLCTQLREPPPEPPQTPGEVPSVSIQDATVDENGGSLAFTVTQSVANPYFATTVDYETSDITSPPSDTYANAGSDYTAETDTVEIPAGATSATISVEVTNEAVYESDETFKVTLSNPIGATVEDNEAIGRINNDDAAPRLSINKVSRAEGKTGTSIFSFTVSKSGATQLPAEFTYATEDQSAKASQNDYISVSPTRVAIDPTQTRKTLSVTVKGDITYEPNETFLVRLSAPLDATIATVQGLGTILDDDGPVISRSTVAAQPGAVPPDGTASVVTVTLKNAFNAPLPGMKVTLTKSSGPVIATVTPATGATTNSVGQAVFKVSSASGVEGIDNFSAKDVTDNMNIKTVSITFKKTAVSALKSTVVASPASVPANGTSFSTVTVTLKNGNGVVVPSRVVSLTKVSGAGTPVIRCSVSPCATNTQGLVKFTVKSTTKATNVFVAKNVTDNLALVMTASVRFT